MIEPPDEPVDLFDWAARRALARTTDPGTSHAAAASLDEDAIAFLERVVLDELRAAPNGLTSHEIADRTGKSYATITPRMRPLERRRFLIDSGEKRVPPGWTRNSIIWMLPTKIESCANTLPEGIEPCSSASIAW